MGVPEIIIIVSAVLIVSGVAASAIVRKLKGKRGCSGCGCAGCPYGSSCGGRRERKRDKDKKQDVV